MTNLIMNTNVEIEIKIDPFEMGKQIMLECDNVEQLEFFLGFWSGMQELGPYAYHQILAISDEAKLQGKSYEIQRVAEILRQYFLEEI